MGVGKGGNDNTKQSRLLLFLDYLNDVAYQHFGTTMFTSCQSLSLSLCLDATSTSSFSSSQNIFHLFSGAVSKLNQVNVREGFLLEVESTNDLLINVCCLTILEIRAPPHTLSSQLKDVWTSEEVLI